MFVCVDSNVIIYLNNMVISSSEIELKKIETFNDLQSHLFKLDKIKCCQGSVSYSRYPEVKSSFGIQYVESNGQWRHAKCSNIVNDNR